MKMNFCDFTRGVFWCSPLVNDTSSVTVWISSCLFDNNVHLLIHWPSEPCGSCPVIFFILLILIYFFILIIFIPPSLTRSATVWSYISCHSRSILQDGRRFARPCDYCLKVNLLPWRQGSQWKISRRLRCWLQAFCFTGWPIFFFYPPPPPHPYPCPTPPFPSKATQTQASALGRTDSYTHTHTHDEAWLLSHTHTDVLLPDVPGSWTHNIFKNLKSLFV